MEAGEVVVSMGYCMVRQYRQSRVGEKGETDAGAVERSGRWE